LPAAKLVVGRTGHNMAVYKGLFKADHDLHNYCVCAQIACLSMADGTQSMPPYHLLKCCQSTDIRGKYCQRPCSPPHIKSHPCHCYSKYPHPRHKTFIHYRGSRGSGDPVFERGAQRRT
jgi:hypothetical protein